MTYAAPTHSHSARMCEAPGFNSGFLFVFGFLFGHGFGLGSANGRKEGLGSGGRRHIAHQQSPSFDRPSVDRIAGNTVRTELGPLPLLSRINTSGAGVWPERQVPHFH